MEPYVDWFNVMTYDIREWQKNEADVVALLTHLSRRRLGQGH
jgi:GH18 family chitinase